MTTALLRDFEWNRDVSTASRRVLQRRRTRGSESGIGAQLQALIAARKDARRNAQSTETLQAETNRSKAGNLQSASVIRSLFCPSRSTALHSEDPMTARCSGLPES